MSWKTQGNISFQKSFLHTALQSSVVYDLGVRLLTLIGLEFLLFCSYCSHLLIDALGIFSLMTVLLDCSNSEFLLCFVLKSSK